MMKDKEYLFEKNITPEEVLEMIIDIQRQSKAFFTGILSKPEISFETTILDWFDIFDCDDTDEVSNILNSWFMLEISIEEWLKILEPTEEKRIKDLCEFISLYGKNYELFEFRAFGNISREAGIFLTLKSIMRREGFDVKQMKPSSSVKDYIKRDVSKFICCINILAPNKLPKIEIKPYLIVSIVSYGFVISILGLIINFFVNFEEGTLILIVQAIFSIIFIFFISDKIPLREVKMGEIDDFRDLVKQIKV